MTPEQKMIQYLRLSMQKLKQTHREKEKELREQHHLDTLKYHQLEESLVMKIRVQGKMIERLRQKQEDNNG